MGAARRAGGNPSLAPVGSPPAPQAGAGVEALIGIQSDIDAAESVAGLIATADARMALARESVRRAVDTDLLMGTLSALNDRLAVRAIDLVARGFDLPTKDYCWMAMGSEGRLEQTLSTDQDNGLIFSVPEGSSADAVRAGLLPFAEAVNLALAECGFPLCKGRIMAGNPAWCLSLAEWKARFSQWIFEPVPEALLNASIFFDFRGLCGRLDLSDDLRDWLMGTAVCNTMFLYQMAANALQCRPPLGVIRDFVFLDDAPAYPHTIDLKMYGARPFIDAARVFSLAYEIAETGTAGRLRGAAPHIGLNDEDLEAVLAGFRFIQSLRLQHQVSAGSAEGGQNRINPDTLEDAARRDLKRAFKLARRLQTRLALDYQL